MFTYFGGKACDRISTYEYYMNEKAAEMHDKLFPENEYEIINSDDLNYMRRIHDTYD